MTRGKVASETLGRRRLLMAGGLAGASVLSSCFGNFAATRGLLEWNEDVGEKWVNWVVFLGLCIVPVYELFVLADVLVFNSVEFWTGDNPVASNSGRVLTRHATADPNLLGLKVSHAGRTTFSGFLRRTPSGSLQLLDESKALISEVGEDEVGEDEPDWVLSGSSGQALLRWTPRERALVAARIERGEAVSRAFETALGDRQGDLGRLRTRWAASALL